MEVRPSIRNQVEGKLLSIENTLPARKLSLIEKTMLETDLEWKGILEWARENGFTQQSLSTLDLMQNEYDSGVELVKETRFEKLLRRGLEPEEALKLRNQVARRLREAKMSHNSQQNIFIKEGPCQVRKRSFWMERWERRYLRLNLRSETLRIGKHQGACETGKCPKVRLVDVCRIQDGVDGEFAIYVRDHNASSKMRAIHLKVDNEGEALRWVDMLREKVYMLARTYHVGPGSIFPERTLGYLPTTGVCITGGGARSYSATVGQIRGLSKNGCIEKFQYSSCVSASSWAMSIYTFYNSGAANDDELLGTDYLPWDLSNVSMEHLRRSACPMVHPATRNIMSEASAVFFSNNPHDMWTEMVSNVYLKPFGLDASATFTLPELVENVLELNPQLEDERFHVAHPNRPFMIINATIVGPEWARLGESLAPIQFTPMYSGSPFCHVVDYTPKYSSSDSKTKRVWVGGGMLDTFAFGSREPAKHTGNLRMPPALRSAWGHIKRNLEKVESEIRDFVATANDSSVFRKHSMGGVSGKLVQLERPRKLFPLKHACGISSDAPGLKLQHSAIGNRYNPQGLMWSPEALRHAPQKQEAQVFDMVDGGSLDNTGLLALLQRKVRRCVVFVNSRLGIPLEEGAESDGESQSQHPVSNASSRWNLGSLLGFQTSKSDPEVRHTRSYAGEMGVVSRSEGLLGGVDHKISASSDRLTPKQQPKAFDIVDSNPSAHRRGSSRRNPQSKEHENFETVRSNLSTQRRGSHRRDPNSKELDDKNSLVLPKHRSTPNNTPRRLESGGGRNRSSSEHVRNRKNSKNRKGRSNSTQRKHKLSGADRRHKSSGMGKEERKAAYEANVIMAQGTQGLKQLKSFGEIAKSKVGETLNTPRTSVDSDDDFIGNVDSLESILTDATSGTVDGEEFRDYSTSDYEVQSEPDSEYVNDDDAVGDEVGYEEFPNLDILSLFGAKIDPLWRDFGDFEHNQVFANPELRALLYKFKELKKQGKPLVVQDRYGVLENEWWGIEGGWDVDILWIYLDKSEEFIEQLGPDVQEEIAKGVDGAFPNFPNFKTLNANSTMAGHRHHFVDSCLTLEQVNLLSAYTEWVVDQNLNTINRFLDMHSLIAQGDGLSPVHELN